MEMSWRIDLELSLRTLFENSLWDLSLKFIFQAVPARISKFSSKACSHFSPENSDLVNELYLLCDAYKATKL